ncbi:PH domain-containing protein [Oceanobacillus sp. 1P07AA]
MVTIHRLEITYSNYKVIQISPKNMQRFIKELQKINREIKVIT